MVATVPGCPQLDRHRPPAEERLRDTEVWRRIHVPSTATLARLHGVIQRAMGWQDYHLHEFEIGGVRYGIDDGEDWGDPPKDERRAKLDRVAPVGISFAYQYDFGDCWDHDIEVEALLPKEAGKLYPRCVAGAGACPPEDCGGTTGFAELLEVLADPEHDEHESTLDWVGGGFDAEHFDLPRSTSRCRSSPIAGSAEWPARAAPQHSRSARRRKSEGNPALDTSGRAAPTSAETAPDLLLRSARSEGLEPPTESGIHTGDLEGWPATGKRFTLEGCNITQLQDGLILDERSYWDWESLRSQA